MIFLAMNFATVPVFARQTDRMKRPFTNEEVDVRLSEFFYRKSYGKVLVPVKLMGDVEKPGLYHVPHATDLATLLSISGGPSRTAEADSILVSRAGGRSSEEVDIEDLVKGEQKIRLTGGETIWVPPREGLVDGTTYTTIAAVAGVLGIVLSGFLIADQLKD